MTRKVTDAAGRITFSGWSGSKCAVPHTVEVMHKGQGNSLSKEVQLKGQEHVAVAIEL